jgi:hypothetical protein
MNPMVEWWMVQLAPQRPHGRSSFPFCAAELDRHIQHPQQRAWALNAKIAVETALGARNLVRVNRSFVQPEGSSFQYSGFAMFHTYRGFTRGLFLFGPAAKAMH